MSSKIRVLHFSSHDEDCGIAKYQELFLKEMAKSDIIENKFFYSSPYKTRLMDEVQLRSVEEELAEELKSYDILHIQHEFGMYGETDFGHIINAGKLSGKKIIVTLHISPTAAMPKPAGGGIGPRSLLNRLRTKVAYSKFNEKFAEPLRRVDMVIVHNESTKQAAIQLGVSESRIRKIIIPVPSVNHDLISDEIKSNLRVEKGDIVYATVGFLHKYKGIMQSVKALAYLPENYKLAIIGGMHQTSDHISFYDKITDLIRDLGVMHRVYITGFRQDDNELNALIREVDICVYPYDKKYYSNVSSASLNNAFANFKPVVAYPTSSFDELGKLSNALKLTDTFSYYELVRTIKNLDIQQQTQDSKEFASKFSYGSVTKELIALYDEATRL